MSQTTVNERLRILVDKLGLSVSAFSDAIGVAGTTTRNYIVRGTVPKSNFLAKVTRQFEYVNPNWLFTGEGEIFLSDKGSATSSTITAHKNKGNIQSNAGSNNTITNNVKLEDCQRDLAAAKSESELLREQLASKDALLAAKDVVIAAKDETITLLRATYNRPN